MSDILIEQHHSIITVTLNRVEKHNAFDDAILAQLLEAITKAPTHPNARVLLLRANGKHFSAGADLTWMKRMATYNEAENLNDATLLAQVMYQLHQCPLPTVAMVQGAAMGGGAGLVAACDIAIAADTANFCFSEVKLGLIPAVISPYVIKAVGERAANWLFMSAETLSAARALTLNLIHYVIPNQELETFTERFLEQFITNAPGAQQQTKSLVRHVANHPLDDKLVRFTAEKIAKQRVSAEGQRGLHAFLSKTIPQWN